MLKSLGLAWIPGVMAGMMVSGASPVYAGIYQFIIVAMIPRCVRHHQHGGDLADASASVFARPRSSRLHGRY
jgi:hypothetical protein